MYNDVYSFVYLIVCIERFINRGRCIFFYIPPTPPLNGGGENQTDCEGKKRGEKEEKRKERKEGKVRKKEEREGGNGREKGGKKREKERREDK